jgi:hypothetical protein
MHTCVWTTSIIGSSSSNSLLPPAVTHGCRLISASCNNLIITRQSGVEWNGKRERVTITVKRFSGFTSIIPRSKFWQSGGTKWGMWKTPRLTFSRSCRRLSSSKGKAPTSKAYRITPHDHTSARLPSYFSPLKNEYIFCHIKFAHMNGRLIAKLLLYCVLCHVIHTRITSGQA